MIKHYLSYFILSSFLLALLPTIQAQDDQKIYYAFSYCKTHVSWRGARPSNYVIILSPVFRGTKAEIRERSYEFIDQNESVIAQYDNKLNSCDHISDLDGKSHYFENLEDAINYQDEVVEYWNNKYSVSYKVIKKQSLVGSKYITKKVFFSNLQIEDMYLDGEVTVKAKFVFMGYPYIVSEYDNLTISKISYKGEVYTSTTNINDRNLPIPYRVKAKPMIDADYYIWTPKVKNPKTLSKEDYKIFTYPIKRLVVISDHFDNQEADAYFKGFSHPSEKDSYFWQNSMLQHPRSDVGRELSPIKINSISTTLKSEIANKIEEYEYHKNRDFWGTKKETDSEERSKSEEDDFWNK